MWPEEVIQALERLIRAYAEAADCEQNDAPVTRPAHPPARKRQPPAVISSSRSRHAPREYADQLADPA